MPSEEQTYREGVLHKLDDLKKAVEGVDTKITFTNGKVRKIIIAMVLLAGIVIGQSVTNTRDLISLVAGIVR